MPAHTPTRICRVLLGLAVLWGIIGLSGAGSWADDVKHTRATLRGIEGVNVLLEDLEPEVERAGLTTHQLQTDVEVQLRKAGIRVLTEEEMSKTPGSPWLYIAVHVFMRSDQSLAAFTVRVELRQWASLETDASRAMVSTWSIAATGSVGNAKFDSVRPYVKDSVDVFINAYLSVHPRPPGSTAPSFTSPRRDLIR